ncbi:sensory neuron membrane protein 2-like [Vanessa cardui]|uniref:sensory neuron membrane protein 2-like n=1 Tax=Vanessa cardui TaxID=171605 RepID=UPI001F12C649|nr:sensory neuron membrane protein 2-like [Vanessa cardui]XP_046978734.1 sensory neuron membrane protein 2-like [Vanessa cardui]XP_046978735.1 sensory neuron membrane protein 2-like [Vanessa cardui]
MLGKNAKLFFAVSVCILIAAIVLASWGFPKIVHKQIQKNLQLENSSAMFEKWRELPVPLTFKIYVFNVTNADDVTDGAKPILNEIGPFVYKEYRVKRILGYGDNDTIRYMLKKTFYFDQEASGSLREDEEITVINYSYMAAILTVLDIMPAAVTLVNGALTSFFSNLTDPFLRVKAKDLFFDGIFLNCVGENAALSLVCGKIRLEKPTTMRPSENNDGFYFSMFSHLNTTESGPYDMKRGIENVHELGNIVAYNNMTTMSQWGDPYCGQLNGSDSSIFPPIEGNPPKRIYTYEPEICRSLYASLVDKRDIFNISAYYYEIDEMLLASKSANPGNKCFCKKDWSSSHDGCLLMGVLNLNPCKNVPAIVSLPHFYLASEELLEYFDGGISPDKEKHKSFAYLDATTGVVIKGTQRLQFNIELRNVNAIPQLEYVKTGLFPLLWIEEGAEISEELQQELHQSHKMLSYVEAIRWAILGLAVILCIASAMCVSRAGGLNPWPRNHNSVSFILRPGNTVNINKGR